MPGTNYIPTRDAQLRDWANNFAAYFAANAVALGFTVTDGTSVTALVAAFTTAYQTAINPPTRTSATVAAKNSAKATMLASLRNYAQRTNANPAVTNLQRQSLGITVRDRNPTRIPIPTQTPFIGIVSAESLLHRLRYADTLTPNSRRKPAGVSSLHLYVTVAAEVSDDPATAAFVGAFGRQPILKQWEIDQAGQVATYFARWANSRGEEGPWSNGAALGIVA